MKHMIRSLEQERAAYQKTIERMRSCLPPDALTDVEMTQIKTGPNGKAKTAAKKPWWQPRGLAALGRHTGRDWSEQMRSALVRGCYCCTAAQEWQGFVNVWCLDLQTVWEISTWCLSADDSGGRMVSVILAPDCSISASKPLLCLIFFYCQFEGEIKMHNILPFSALLVITGEFLKWHKRNVSAASNLFEHCLDVFTTSLSSTTIAVNRRCRLANNPLDLRVNL